MAWEMLRVLKKLGQETHLILSGAACMNLSIETDYSLDEVKSLANVVYNNKDVGAAVASGSIGTRGMIRRALHHQDAFGDRQLLLLQPRRACRRRDPEGAADAGADGARDPLHKGTSIS